jgi:hypothetical protein
MPEASRCVFESQRFRFAWLVGTAQLWKVLLRQRRIANVVSQIKRGIAWLGLVLIPVAKIASDWRRFMLTVVSGRNAVRPLTMRLAGLSSLKRSGSIARSGGQPDRVAVDWSIHGFAKLTAFAPGRYNLSTV